METKRILQLFTLGIFLVGFAGIVGYLVPGLLPLAGDQALAVGAGFLTIGVVMLTDLRRRNWGEKPKSSQ